METATAVIEEVKPNADVELPSLAEYEQKALVLRQSVELARIENDDQFRAVAQVALDAAANVKAMTAVMEPLRVKRYNALQRIYDILKEKVKPLEETKKKASQLCGQYQLEQEQKRQADEARLRREEQERARKLQEEQATQLAEEGRTEEGLALLETEPEPVPIIAPVSMPKVAGISAPSIKYSAEIIDLKALVKAVFEGKVPLNAFGQLNRVTGVWELDTKNSGQSFLDNQAKQFQDLFDYPGCRIKKTVGSSVRAPR